MQHIRAFTVIPAVALFALAASPRTAQSDEGAALCATPAQSAQVAPLYATSPSPPLFMAATKLGLPEAIVASSLPVRQAVGVSGAEFSAVWESLQTWDAALTLVLKGGSVFEIRGRIPPGEPSTKSQFYNLKAADTGLGGHLRPDLIGAIYAVSLVGAEGPMRGVTFLDKKGEGVFGVYLPEGDKPSPAVVAEFEKTRALIASLPRACPP